MLATEEQGTPHSDHPAHGALLEEWHRNEVMRHLPAIAWIVDKLDGDVRRRIERLWLPFSDISASDPHHDAIEREFRALGRSLERTGEIARRHRGNPHPPNDLGPRITWTLNQAISNLNAIEPGTFGHRFPVQTFERSFAEPLWASVLVAISHLHRLADLVREIEPNIDERLYENLVTLQEPLRREPIA